MSEQYDEQETRDAFAAMRGEVLTLVRPAGAAAVARTVGRRRRTRMVAGAAAVVIAAGGAVTVTNLTADRSAPSAQRSSAAAGPGVDRERLTAMATKAAKAINLSNKARVAEGKGQNIDGINVVLDGRAGDGISVISGADKATTDRIVAVACAGRGTLQVQIWAAPPANEPDRKVPADARRLTVPCTDDPVPVITRLPVPYPQVVMRKLTSDEAAVGNSAYAYSVRRPNRDGS